MDYLKSYCYMFAPLIGSPHPKACSSSTTRLEYGRLMKKMVDCLKSDSYTYASFSGPQPIISPPKGSIPFLKRVSMEISARTLTVEDNQPTVKSTNVMAEDQHFKGNLLETSISHSQTLTHKEIAKNRVYP